MRILVIEDDDILLELLTQRLSDQHYAIDSATDGKSGWEYASTYKYDLVILDVVLPQIDGISLCQKLRQFGHTLPILMLTSQDTSIAKIMGLDAGADDYVVKPFDEAELIARIRALLRRGSSNPLPIITWGNLWLNSNTHEVSYAGKVLDLTAKEYSLIEMMLRESQHVFSKDEILESLWSSEEFPVDATVRSHMRRLRNKLSAAGAPHDLVSTAHGRGYYLKPCAQEPFQELPLESPQDEPTIAQSSPQLPLVKPRISTAITSGTNSIQEERSQSEQAQYWTLLNRTWRNNRDRCSDRVKQIYSAITPLKSNCLSEQIRSEAYRAAHNLVGTLGTFGLQDAMEIARSLEQEFHPDIHLEPNRATYIQALTEDLQNQIEHTQTLPGQPEESVNETIDRDRQSQTEKAEKLAFAGNQDRRSKSDIRLMIVDDDPIFLKTIPNQMRAYNFEISILDDPQQFWPALNGIRPDVLILDIQMPSINGLQLCHSLRSDINWQKLPVLFLSVLADMKTQKEAFAAGADDYLCKPITVQTLSDRIQYRLQRIQAYSR